MALLEKLGMIHGSPVPPRPSKKGFVPQVPNIPVLRDYTVDPGRAFWEVFPVNRNMRGGTPFKMDVEVLMRLAAMADLSDPDMELMSEVIKDVRDGADLKV